MSSFDLAVGVITAYTESINQMKEIDSHKLEMLCEFCSTIDLIISENDGRSITCDVVDNNISISIELFFSFVYESGFKSPDYLNLLEHSLRIRMTNKGEEYVGVEFVLPGVWKN